MKAALNAEQEINLEKMVDTRLQPKMYIERISNRNIKRLVYCRYRKRSLTF